MSIHITHHTYNIAMTKKTLENIFYLRNSPVQPLTTTNWVYQVLREPTGDHSRMHIYISREDDSSADPCRIFHLLLEQASKANSQVRSIFERAFVSRS